jgi:uncharacterized membrane protein YeaQ/YmgE (transglycosylase-associated protein family)
LTKAWIAPLRRKFDDCFTIAAKWRQPLAQRRDHVAKLEVFYMTIIAWIILGLVAGFIGSKIVNKSGDGVILDIGLGVIGAVVGGWLFHTFGMAGVSGLNLYSLLVAVLGAVVVLVVYHTVRRSGVVS